MSHHEHAFDSAVAYHQHVVTGITSAFDHLIAASLAADVAEAEYLRAGQADTADERLLFLRAADKARATRDHHELVAEITAIGEQVLG